MWNLGIKLKLIILFVIFKVIPLFIVAFVAIQGAMELNRYFETNTKTLFSKNKELIETTASNAIEDSIKALDQTSQTSLEKLSVALASNVADFLYERDSDILFLSKLPMNQKNIESFYRSKKRAVTVHEDYIYDEKGKKWVSSGKPVIDSTRDTNNAKLKDNEKEFHFVDPLNIKTKMIPIYKEISFIDLNGREIYKSSSLNIKKLNISKKKNTYCSAEDYFNKLKGLKKGEIYVSDVIGAYVPSKVIGSFSKEKAAKMGIEFKPELHGYAGVENPKGKRFEGIVRFVTPVFEGDKKNGYLSLALDHRHIMEFTDSFNPTKPNIKQNIANAGEGNYAFMWDYEARNISHPRDYFIVGFDPETGERVPGWISKKIAEEFKVSGKTGLNDFLEDYPKFDNQSLDEKPNISQLKNTGEIGLDCRYLNFAPQCQGWMQLTENGGYGSFVIFWSKVWKLTTAATIPYYTGQYGDTKRGFGFVTIGANVDEFHEAADKTKENINTILESQNKKLEESLEQNSNQITTFIDSLVNELSFITFIMVMIVIFLAIWMSNYITSKIEKLILGTQHFSNNDLDYRIKVSSKDEIGKLENAFNEMAHKIQTEIETNKNKEAMLVQKNKMAEVGDMMSAIVHQWKQPLNAITMSTSSARLTFELEQKLSDEEIHKLLDRVEEQIDHMGQTMDDFRNFFKPAHKEEYSLGEITRSVNRMLGKVYESQGINIRYKEDKDSIVEGYPSELMQVLINILNNSKDAIFETEAIHKEIDLFVGADDGDGVIKIRDYAGGIPEDIIDNIFKPYFTTKSEDKGTGIGLHMSLNIIKKANGTLEVKNVTSKIDDKEYEGAEFTIRLKK